MLGVTANKDIDQQPRGRFPPLRPHHMKGDRRCRRGSNGSSAGAVRRSRVMGKRRNVSSSAPAQIRSAARLKSILGEKRWPGSDLRPRPPTAPLRPQGRYQHPLAAQGNRLERPGGGCHSPDRRRARELLLQSSPAAISQRATLSGGSDADSPVDKGGPRQTRRAAPTLRNGAAQRARRYPTSLRTK